MRKKYKKSHIIINIVLSLVLIFLLVNMFVIKNTNFWFLGGVLFVTFFLLVLIFGYEKKKLRFTYETMFYVFTYPVVYLIATYAIGIFIGFNVNVYKLNIETLIYSILPYTMILLFGELLRYEITRKGEGSKLSYILVTIILVLIDCTLFLTTFDLSTGDGKIQFICYIFLSSISKNCFLTYISKIGGPYPIIIYRIIMDLKLFIMPIFPDFGIYIESVLNVAYPVFLGMIIARNLEQYKNKQVNGWELRKKVTHSYISVGTMGIVIVTIVVLISTKSTYGAMAIGSGSMTGTINKGDVAIYEVLSDKCVPKKKKVIVFRKDGKVIVHRIIKVVEVSDNEFVYYTKGDANDKPDGYPLTTKDIIGVVKYRIKYMGMPSVALYELTHRK